METKNDAQAVQVQQLIQGMNAVAGELQGFATVLENLSNQMPKLASMQRLLAAQLLLASKQLEYGQAIAQVQQQAAGVDPTETVGRPGKSGGDPTVQ